jgi:general secretion pathway protein E
VPDIRDLANQAPVVRYVNLLLSEAVRLRASDVHLDGSREGVTVRFRLDGSMSPGLPAPVGLDRAIVSRIKVLADLDISERRAPQDGSFRVRLDDALEVDLRVSTSPTVFGESLVLRILDRGTGHVSLGELGLPLDLHDAVERVAAQQHGMLLSTGPTGSGKTTTLYAALGTRDAEAEKIITIEDPVEYSLSGVSQIPVGSVSGVTFARALRSVLRQDPDVIMVGEIRDGETAQLAVQAALTGHLVLSSLHTTDAPGAVARMLDLGVPDFLLAATLSGVLAQRLVRRVCPSCRREEGPEARHVDLLQAAMPECRDLLHGGFWKGVGCPECRSTGYRGRVGLFEFLEVTEPVRLALTSEPTPTAIRDASGVAGLAVDGVQKARQGITSLEEVVRAIQ